MYPPPTFPHEQDRSAPATPPVHPPSGSPTDPAAPVSPPVRPTVGGPAVPSPAPTPASVGAGGSGAAPTTNPTPAPLPARRGRVGVAAVAFLLGGMVGAGGFALGASTSGSETVAGPAETVPISTTIDSAPAPTVTAPLVEVDPDLLITEPAAAVAASLGPSVVQVETNRGQGSGVVYADGLILTNHHVIEGATQVRVRADDGRVFETEVLGSDPRNDIAVLSAADSDLPVAAIGSSAALQPGQVTVAIGSPFQLQQTVTAGIVSSVNRPIPNRGGTVTAMIQTDAPINPGNSGGALANINGELVGINTSIRTDGTSNTNAGIGFAVPIDTAIDVAERIVEGQSLDPGVLGISGANGDGELGVPIAEVTAGSGAEAAGLQVDDRVVTIDGIPVTDIQELAGLIQSHFSGEEVELEVLRDGQRLTVEATLS